MNQNETKKFEDKRILVTGGTGFIGSHIVRRLVKYGSEVYVLMRKQSNTYRIDDCKDKIYILYGDIENYNILKKYFRKIEPEIIFHLAAYVNRNRSFKFLDKCLRINLYGTINVLKALEKVNYERFVNTGTSEEYGNIKAPFREDYLIKPVSPYSFSKASAVFFCETYHKIYGYPIVNLRPFLIYGPFQDEKMFIPKLIISCIKGFEFKMTKGEQGRDFVYVDDIVNGFLKSSYINKAIGETINLGSGKEYKIKYVAKLINKIMGNPIKILYELPYRKNEIWHLYCDNTKAKKLLGWSPKINLKEGLIKTINWYMRYEKQRKN